METVPIKRTLVAGEAVVRDHLSEDLARRDAGVRSVVREFWIPRSHERADLVLLGDSLDGYEIKTERDTLRRLPRQALAYEKVFDRCVAVVAERHAAGAAEILSEAWGLVVVESSDQVAFHEVRPSRPNSEVCGEVLVRLLWKAEASAVLVAYGREPDPALGRPALWAQLLDFLTLEQLRVAVRSTLVARDPGQARIPTRRFTDLAQAL